MRHSKHLLLLIAAFFSFAFGQIAWAASDTQSGSYLENRGFTGTQLQKPLTVKGFFTLYFNSIGEGIPDSYRYIELNFLGIERSSPAYGALQKGVYLNLIRNVKIDLGLEKLATESLMERFVKENFDEEIDATPDTPLKLEKFLQIMQALRAIAEEDKESSVVPKYEIENTSGFPILNDVYLKLKTSHYDSEKFTDESLLRGAIKGMSESTGDRYTTYFPPAEAKNFNEQLSGEFEGIGAQVDMEKPGILTIIAPLSGSPAERAGLKTGDRILKIDDEVIDEKFTLETAVKKIKGPAGTKVKLFILRGGTTLEIIITREKISMQYVQYKKLDNGDDYIQITTFGERTAADFSGAVESAFRNAGSKVIIDLRNNPGGSLDEVSEILNFFVPKGQSSVNIKYRNYSTEIYSQGSENRSFDSRKIVLLVNKGSASASEIMAGTIKDYLGEKVRIVGEKTYGKGSVQILDQYPDGSSFKFTVAKWFTGKSKIGIDGIGIAPDIEVKEDEAANKATGKDNQLEYVKNLRF